MTPANDNNNRRRPAWFDELLLKYRPFIYKRCTNEPDKEDLVQAVMLRALEKWHQYNPVFNFATWLSFMCRDVLRERKPTPPGKPLQSVEPSQEYAVDIRTAMSMLTRREGRAITLVATGHSNVEAARKMRVSRQGLDGMLARARAKVANDNEPKKRVA